MPGREPWLIFMYHKCQLSMSIYIMLLPHCGYVSSKHMYLKTENRHFFFFHFVCLFFCCCFKALTGTDRKSAGLRSPQSGQQHIYNIIFAHDFGLFGVWVYFSDLHNRIPLSDTRIRILYSYPIPISLPFPFNLFVVNAVVGI